MLLVDDDQAEIRAPARTPPSGCRARCAPRPLQASAPGGEALVIAQSPSAAPPWARRSARGSAPAAAASGRSPAPAPARAARRQHPLDQLQVDLGLAAAGDAVQHEGAVLAERCGHGRRPPPAARAAAQDRAVRTRRQAQVLLERHFDACDQAARREGTRRLAPGTGMLLERLRAGRSAIGSRLRAARAAWARGGVHPRRAAAPPPRSAASAPRRPCAGAPSRSALGRALATTSPIGWW